MFGVVHLPFPRAERERLGGGRGENVAVVEYESNDAQHCFRDKFRRCTKLSRINCAPVSGAKQVGRGRYGSDGTVFLVGSPPSSSSSRLFSGAK